MADDSHGMGIPLPADSTLIHRYPAVARAMGEKIAEILAGGLTAGQLAAVEEMAAGALLKELKNLPVVLTGDPGIPSAGDYAGYEEIVINTLGQIARGLTTEGTNHLPQILADRLKLGETTQESIDYPGYSKVSLNAGRMGEDALDDKGNVPQWVLDRWAARLPGATAAAPVHLLIVAGQSNATKRGNTTEATLGTKYDDPRVLRWSHGSGAIITETGTNWLGSGFARQWIKDNPTKRILIVEAAVGSTGFWGTSIRPAPAGYSETAGTWDRKLTADPNNFPLTLLRDRVAAASAAAKELTGTEPPKIAMLWCQGENDTGHAAEYAEKMDDLFTWARQLWGTPNLPVLVASMTPATIKRTNGARTLDLGQQDTPRRLPLTAYHRGPEAMEENTANRTHYQPIAQEIRGAEIAARILPRALRNSPAADPQLAVIPPGSLTLTRSGTAARISWEHPPCRFSALQLETSTDEGATWTAHALPVPGAVEYEITAPAAAPLWARVCTVHGDAVSYYREIRS